MRSNLTSPIDSSKGLEDKANIQKAPTKIAGVSSSAGLKRFVIVSIRQLSYRQFKLPTNASNAALLMETQTSSPELGQNVVLLFGPELSARFGPRE